MSKRSFSWQPLRSQQVNGCQTLLKSERRHFYATVLLILDKLSWKKLLLVTFEMQALFANTLTADGSYSCSERESFWQQYQKQKFVNVLMGLKHR